MVIIIENILILINVVRAKLIFHQVVVEAVVF